MNLDNARNNARNLFQLQIDLIDGKIEIKIRDEIKKVLERINNLESAMNQRLSKLENTIR